MRWLGSIEEILGAKFPEAEMWVMIVCIVRQSGTRYAMLFPVKFLTFRTVVGTRQI